MLPVVPSPAYRNCPSCETASGAARMDVGTVRRVLPVRGSITAIAGPVAGMSVDRYSSPEAGLYARSSAGPRLRTMDENASVLQVTLTLLILAPATCPVALAMVQSCPSGGVAIVTV